MEVIALAVLAAGAIGGVLTLALKALNAERRAGEQATRAGIAEVNQTSLAAMLADETNRRKQEADRADRLDDTIAQMVASVPVAGAYQRLLQIAGSAKTDRRDGAGGVPAPVTADAGRDTDLLRPGD